MEAVTKLTTYLLVSFLLLHFSISASTNDTLEINRTLRDRDSIISKTGLYELGFFSPGNSTNRYLGIWFRDISPLTVAWVANRVSPIVDKSGTLSITSQGNLTLLNNINGVVWSTNTTRLGSKPIAQLLDTGNFVVLDENEEILWQSFDYPCDTLLPEMKLGFDKITGKSLYLSSWKTTEDPSPGDYLFGVDPIRFSQIGLFKGSTSNLLGTSGSWNGEGFSGTPGYRPNPYFKFNFVYKNQSMYYSYDLYSPSTISRMVISPTGIIQRFLWRGPEQGWVLYLSVTPDNCFQYKLCGPFSTCNANNLPICGCLPGFEPANPQAWHIPDWSDGCTRKSRLSCNSGDKFSMYSNAKLPDALNYWYDESMGLEECEWECLKTCSCTAYANSDVRNGRSGCLVWFGDLNDIRTSPDNGQVFYIRMSASEIGEDNNLKPQDNSRKKKMVIIIILMTVGGMLTFGLFLGFLLRRRKLQLQNEDNHGSISQENVVSGGAEKEDNELPFFDFAVLAKATDNFSLENKLGEGGFGAVYKGILSDAKEIAVKRWSEKSDQGLAEFKNEVRYISKLQHRNLVRLLGCCIRDGEKMLVYEYMPNRSLDSVLFDQIKSMALDWEKRIHIINGIARGLLYLHEDSRLRIVHRDLKASNILLDSEMNPKISDFGMARSFLDNVTEGNTLRVAGTFGYMAPEYIIDGLYSTKSDVFSYGVLVLEIVSGKKNRRFNHPDHPFNLLGHAWKLFMEHKPLELVDPSIRDTCRVSQVLRSIHLGLLCVQQVPDDRPSMSSVVLVLGSENVLPLPKAPGFYAERGLNGFDTSSASLDFFSTNSMSTTLLEPR